MKSRAQSPPENPIKEFAQIKQHAEVAFTSAKATSDYDRKITDFKEKRKKSEQEFRQDVISFRRGLFFFLLILMTLETVTLFAIIIMASLRPKILFIEDVTLQILVGATIAQISAMIIVITRSVYSDTLNKFIMSDEHSQETTY